MKNRDTIKQVISSFFKNEAEQSLKLQFQYWITRQKFEAEKDDALKDIWDDLAIAEPDRSTFNSLKNINKKIDRRKIQWQITWRVAAVILPLFVVLSFWTINNLNPDKSNNSYVKVIANGGAVTCLTLPDSTKVWLNSGSSLEYPTNFKKDLRLVRLNGEGYFEVAKEKARKFIVNLPNDKMSVEVLGTQFNVESYAKDDFMAVVLVEGSVKVNYKSAKNKNTEVRLSPDQKIMYDLKTGSASVTNVSVLTDIAWKKGLIELDNTILEDALRKLAKHYNVEFVVKNEALKEYRFTGTFANEPISDILHYFNMSSNIKYEIKKQENNNISKTIITLY